MVFICLDGLFCCVDAVVIRLDELTFAFFLFEEGLDWFGALIVGDVESRFVALVF